MIFNRLKLAVDRVIAAFSVAVMLALVVCVVWQVFSRYVLNQPSTLTDELARFLMIWVGLLGAAYTVGAQRHLSIDLFALALNKRKQLLLSIVINVLILGFAGSVIVTGGLKLIDKTLATSQVSAAMQIPMGYVYIILPLSGLGRCRAVSGKSRKEAAEGPPPDPYLLYSGAMPLSGEYSFPRCERQKEKSGCLCEIHGICRRDGYRTVPVPVRIRLSG